MVEQVNIEYGVSSIKNNYLEVADPPSNVYVWGSIYFEETVLGNVVSGTALLGFF